MRKQKRVFSLIMASSILFSAVGMEAAAEPINRDGQPAIIADDETVPTMAEEGTEEEAKEKNVEGTEEETGKEAEEGTKEETKEETEGGAKEENREETEEETKEESKKESEEGAKEETREESEEENKKEDLSEGSKDESPVDIQMSDTKTLVNSVLGVHEHSWLADWNYDGTCHWHECGAEGCPVAEDSEKEGYGEHNYDDYGVCTDCGYDAMDGIDVAAEGYVPTYQEAYDAMTALKETYPEGMKWTNFEPYGSNGELGDAYTWNGGAVYGAKSAVGCMAFAFILSDATFDNLPARVIEKGSFTFEDVKVGDILRINSNSHSVVVLRKSAGGVTVAEANYNSSVHWGRSMSAAAVEGADFIITRYPKGYVPSDDLEGDEVVQEGTAGSLSWSLTDSGVLTVSGSGDIPNYLPNNPSPWSNYDIYTVVIEEGVTGIGEYAFYQSGALSVYIPDSVKTIGQSAFYNSALVEVTVPGTVKTIGNQAFYKCENLTSATVSEGVIAIGDSAFQGCTALAYIDFPASITSVGAGAFASCKEMVSARFKTGSGVVTLGDNLFSQCWKLTCVTLPQTIDGISAGMFESCSLLPELYIPATVKEIGENPFTSCRKLQTIYFGGSEVEWNQMANAALKGSLQSTNTTVVYNAEFDDPFATAPNDPGDFQPGESDSCTTHVDLDNDGKCDNCGEAMSAAKPDPDEDKKDPAGSGGNKPPVTDSSSGGSSGSSGSGVSESSGSSSDDGSGNTIISTTSRWEADGSHVITRTQRDGTVITITTDGTGKADMEVRLSGLGIAAAVQKGEAIALPVSAVEVAEDISTAPTITVYTQKGGPVKVAIPVVLPTSGTVAVIVNEDGSTTVIPNSISMENQVVASLSDGATVKIVNNGKSFLDVPAGVWFEDAVSFVSTRELFQSITETTFAPGAPMTYAMLTTALARLDGVETLGGATWYEKGMEWSLERGIWDGSGPNSNITCEQFMTMIWKYQGSPVTADTLSDYGDASQISDGQKAMDWAVKNGFASVFGEEIPDPKRQVNRSQAAQIIMYLVIRNFFHSAQ